MLKYTVFLLALFASSASAWESIGLGVAYKVANAKPNKDNNILITYAGYRVTDAETQAWTDRLNLKSTLNQPVYGIDHLYAVRGPADSMYLGKEIQNSKLIEHLYNRLVNQAKQPKLIVIIAHSSGAYVADEFFTQLYNKMTANPSNQVYASLRSKIVYYNLDGGTTPSRKDSTYIKSLFTGINFVWASENGMNSMNAGTMTAAPNNYAKDLNAKSIQVIADKAKCQNAKCLHDALIIESPYNPLAYDTGKDYTLFSDSTYGKEVQYAFLQLTLSDLNANL